ncbi:MAG TPA: DPP IV N-terminal domain-containing protein [Vicinamibacteria bacterium]|jgi:TolB protein
MICPECFHDLPDGSHDCRHCGTVFADWGDEPGGSPAPKAKGGGRSHSRGSAKAAVAPPRRWRRRFFGLVVLLFLGGVGWLLLEPPLRTVLRPGSVVFVSRRDGNAELYLMRSSGLEPRRLTNHPAADHSPAVSRDGRFVAFVSDRDGNPNVYVLGTDGGGLRRLTEYETPDLGPAWSPAGDRVAFTIVGAEGNGDVGIARADGQGVVNLTSHPSNDHSPAWSPGGTQLAFVSDRDGTPAVYAMYADGRDLRRLTNHAGADSTPTWSPDGTRLAFAWNGDVFVMSADGGAPTRVTDRTRAGGGATGTFESPVWAPDGKRIAATWVDRAGGRAGLVVASADGTRFDELGPAEAGSAVWLADSGSVAFVASPQAGRRWFKAQPYSGGKQVCVRRVAGDRRWTRVRDLARALALSALGGPRDLDASLEILTERGGEDPDWTPGGSERLPRFWDQVSWEGA